MSERFGEAPGAEGDARGEAVVASGLGRVPAPFRVLHEPLEGQLFAPESQEIAREVFRAVLAVESRGSLPRAERAEAIAREIEAIRPRDPRAQHRARATRSPFRAGRFRAARSTPRTRLQERDLAVGGARGQRRVDLGQHARSARHPRRAHGKEHARLRPRRRRACGVAPDRAARGRAHPPSDPVASQRSITAMPRPRSPTRSATRSAEARTRRRAARARRARVEREPRAAR